jgi:hypothetical protein
LINVLSKSSAFLCGDWITKFKASSLFKKGAREE